MKLRFRMTTRNLAVFVAVVALAIGIPIELWNRWLRNQYAAAEAHYLWIAQQHQRELAICRSHQLNDPYVARRDQPIFFGPEQGFKSWPEEAAWRAELVPIVRVEASKMAELKRRYQRRLLIP